ncbi:hypothetical protein QTP88_017804 [Uroleucon formosanum]
MTSRCRLQVLWILYLIVYNGILEYKSFLLNFGNFSVTTYLMTSEIANGKEHFRKW